MRNERKDNALDRKVMQLQADIETWARANGLWSDCGFFDYTERIKPVDWDRTGYVTVLAADGPIWRIIICREDNSPEARALANEFDHILGKHGFWYENYTHTEMWIYAIDPVFERDFREYMHWKWICGLVKPDFDFLDEELYAHFASNPDQFAELNWRDFEKLVAALMESQGYQVELGPGRGDGGIDIKLLQRDPVGDILTLVQVKRYRPDRKIRLEAVQALHGATVSHGAERKRSMFVTTSAYEPSAEKFARRENVSMDLRVTPDVQRWCADARDGIIEDKKKLVSEGHVERAVRTASREFSTILHSRGGYGMVLNRFAVVLKETNTSALLLEIPTRIIDHDGYGQRGREVPDVKKILPFKRIGSGNIKRARRIERGRRLFRDDHNHFSPWDGEAVCFDHCD